MADKMTESITCVARTADVCGEGAVWHPTHNAIYWTDINRGLIHRYRIATAQVTTWTFDQPVTALTLTTNPETLLVVLAGRIILWDPARDDRDRILHEFPRYPACRCNDARVDPGGTLWFGTMQNNLAPDGSTVEVTENLGKLFSLNSAGELKTWQQGIGISNTVAWSPDGRTMYFGDSGANTIWQYEFAAGSISNQRVFTANAAPGAPDGSAVDSAGFLWNCRYGGSSIARFAPDGSLDRLIPVPVPNPTTCTFGGADLRTLYFTSAGEGKQLAGPDDGGLFSFQTEIAGLPSTPYSLTES